MKKLLALCLTVLLVVAMVPVFAVSADATPTIVVSDAEGFSGESVTVNITLANNPGIVSAYLEVAYDAAVLELTEVVAGADFDAMMSYSETLSANPYVLNYADGKTKVDITGTDFATLTFAIKADAAIGDTAVSVSFDPENVFDVNMDAVNFEIDNAVVTVKCAHTNTTVVGAKEATCTAEGYTGDKTCDACDAVVEAGTAIAVKPHTEVTEGAKDATCTEAGSTGTTTCSVCGTTVKEAEEIAAKGHTETTVGAKAATCEDDGYTGDTVCSVCEEVLEKGEVIPALGHDIIEVAAKDATCDEDGNVAHFACETCGTTYADEDGAELKDDVIIKATGHNYADGKCTVCGEDEPKEEEKPTDKPADTEKPADKPNTDDGNKAPATNDVSNIFVVVAMLMAIAAAAVVVLKKKA